MAAIGVDPYETSTGRDHDAPRYSTAIRGETASSRQALQYQQSTSIQRPSTAHDPGYRSKERLRQFHRLSAYQSSPDMIVAEPAMEQAHQKPVVLSNENSSFPAADKGKTLPVTVKRRKSNTVRSSLRKLFGRNSPSSASESAAGDDHKADQSSTQSNINSSSYGTPRRAATPEHRVSPRSKSRQSHSDASNVSPSDNSKRLKKLQHSRLVTPDNELESSPFMNAASTIPVIVSSMEPNATKDDRTWYPSITDHGAKARPHKQRSLKHVKELPHLGKSHVSNQYELGGHPLQQYKPPAELNLEEASADLPPRSKSVPNVASWNRQTEPRQVMEATSLAARIAEVEKRLAEIEYAVHKLTRACYDPSPAIQGGVDERDSGPYLTPPSSQHEKIPADIATSGRSSRSSSKNPRRKYSPVSPRPSDLQVEGDWDTTPRATFLASPSLHEFLQHQVSPERSPAHLRRTNSARNLNAMMKMQDPINTVHSSFSAHHRESKPSRPGISSSAVHLLDALHQQPPSGKIALQSPTTSSISSLSEYPHVQRSRYPGEPTLSSPQPPFDSSASRFSAYETDDSVDDFRTSIPDDQGTDADAEDNITTVLSAKRSSLEASKALSGYFYTNRQNHRGPQAPITPPFTTRPSTAHGGVMQSGSLKARGRLAPRSAGARPFTPSDKKRNDDLRAFLDAGPPT